MVVGVDFSDGAAGAVQEGRRLAQRLGQELRFAHVVEDGTDAIEPGEVGAWLRAQGLERSAIEVLRGVAWIELGRFAAAVSSRLLVVGSHGRTGLQPLWPGRTAMKLAMRSPIPVVVVPARVRSVPVESVGQWVAKHDPEGFRRLGGSWSGSQENVQ